MTHGRSWSKRGRSWRRATKSYSSRCKPCWHALRRWNRSSAWQGWQRPGAVLTAVMAVVEAAGPNLVRTALRLLDPRAGHGAAAALQRALEQLATRVRECQTAMARGATAMATR